MKAYKGFDKDLKCRDFQYEIGKEYEEKTASLCNKGFHACEYPLDCFGYYAPANNRFCEVEIDDNGERNSDDSKVCGARIKIGAEIGIPGLVKAAIEYVAERAKPSKRHHTTGSRSANSATGDWSANSATGDWSANSATGSRSANSATGDWSANSATGDWSANSATGYGSANSATGYGSANSATGSRSANSATGDWSANSATGSRSANSATGDWSANSATGYGSVNVSTGADCSNNGEGERNISIGWGKDNKCKGSVGSFLVLSEWGDWNGNNYPFIGATMVEVDGKNIKADTYYSLVKGKVVECDD